MREKNYIENGKSAVYKNNSYLGILTADALAFL